METPVIEAVKASGEDITFKINTDRINVVSEVKIYELKPQVYEIDFGEFFNKVALACNFSQHVLNLYFMALEAISPMVYDMAVIEVCDKDVKVLDSYNYVDYVGDVIYKLKAMYEEGDYEDVKAIVEDASFPELERLFRALNQVRKEVLNKVKNIFLQGQILKEEINKMGISM